MPFRIFSEVEIDEDSWLLRPAAGQLPRGREGQLFDQFRAPPARPRLGPADEPADRGASSRTCSGPSVVAWGSHFFCKMPRDGKTVSWHQDASYWPLTPSKAVTVWLAIDDADRGNACMQYIPGTHVLGHLTYKLSETDPRTC